MIFHTFRRYEFGCKIKPRARILQEASKQKMYKKYGSASSNCIAKGVRSPSGKCSSIAITAQVAMIVTRIVYSNGGHSMINLNNLRIGFFSPKMKSEEGPGLSTEFWAGTTFTFTFCPKFFVVAVICVSTFAADSCTAALNSRICCKFERSKKNKQKYEVSYVQYIPFFQ